VTWPPGPSETSCGLLIANLAFAQNAPELAVKAILGVLAGSFVSGMIGYVVLAATLEPGRDAASE
jgi:Na+/H+ antiporter NhaA